MKKAIVWILQIICSLLLLQTVYFKFTAHPDTVRLFTELKMEPAGRIIIGTCELVAGMLLLIPGAAVYGALLGAGVMVGAIIGHITILGFAGPRLILSLMAVAILIMCVAVMVLRRGELPIIHKMLDKPDSAEGKIAASDITEAERK